MEYSTWVGPGIGLIVVKVAGGTVSALGDNTIVTPTAGKRINIFYYMYNPETDNTCFWKFGSAGTPQMKCKVPAESVIGRQFDPSMDLSGAINEPLLLNLAVAQSVNFTVFYGDG